MPPIPDLCDHTVLRDLLTRHGFHFRKLWGQHFLTDRTVIDSIVSQAALTPSHGVLEIGPGVGVLTQQLCRQAGHVVSVEVDPRLPPVLTQTLAGNENFSLVQSDILRCDLAALVRTHLSGLSPVVCANLPYQITTPVVTKLLESGLFASLTLMVQKEVALRMCARPNTPEYGAFSLLVQAYTRPRYCFSVPPHCFTPRPAVTSAVISLVRDPIDFPDFSLFFKITRAAFGQRRKMLRSALPGPLGLTREQTQALLTQANIPSSLRGEALDVSQFMALAHAYHALTNHPGH